MMNTQKTMSVIWAFLFAALFLCTAFFAYNNVNAGTGKKGKPAVSSTNGKGTKVIYNAKTAPDLTHGHIMHNGELVGIRVKNDGKPVKVRLLGKSHYLGTGDSVDVKPPSTKSFYVHVKPSDEKDTVLPVQGKGLERSYHVKTPAYQDEKNGNDKSQGA